MKKMLHVHNLHLSLLHKKKQINLINNLNFSIFENEIVGLVGESGSGKSLSALSLLQLLPIRLSVTKGKILYYDQNLLSLKTNEIKKIRGSQISIIFQDALSSLNPTMKIGKQIAEILIKKEKKSFKQAQERLNTLLTLVGLEVECSLKYPHELSGGQRQKALIAIAIAGNPRLLIADEPTTSLDIIMQNQILNLFKEIQRKIGISILLITHDLSIISKICDRVLVMQKGTIVEEGLTEDILLKPKHPYTSFLLKSLPSNIF